MSISNKIAKSFNYPLLSDGYSNQDIYEGIKVLKSKQLTMPKLAENLKIFCKK